MAQSPIGPRAARGCCSAGERELEPEARAGAGIARESDAAAVGLDDAARDREAETGAGEAALARLGPEELREDPRLVLGRDADALVPHLDPDGAVVECAADLDHAALRRVLDGIGEQVRVDLREAVGVAED